MALPRPLAGLSSLVEALLRMYRASPSLGELMSGELPELLSFARTAGQKCSDTSRLWTGAASHKHVLHCIERVGI